MARLRYSGCVRLQRVSCGPHLASQQKYVSPHLKPPSATAYEEDKDAMAAQFDAAEALLREIQAETTAVRVAVEEQNEKVTKVTEEVANVVKDMREGEAHTRNEMREIREEVNTVREMLPKVSLSVR